jgi:hypothetical protein
MEISVLKILPLTPVTCGACFASQRGTKGEDLNFSKKILDYKISDSVCKTVRTETFREALEAYLKEQNHNYTTTLVVDGGPENCNTTVDGYLESVKNILRKVVALKDIIPSNSPVACAERSRSTALNNPDRNRE